VCPQAIFLPHCNLWYFSSAFGSRILPHLHLHNLLNRLPSDAHIITTSMQAIYIQYLSFDASEAYSSVLKLNHCLSDNRDGMVTNFLKLSDEKTGLLLIGRLKRMAKVTDFDLSVVDTKVNPLAPEI